MIIRNRRLNLTTSEMHLFRYDTAGNYACFFSTENELLSAIILETKYATRDLLKRLTHAKRSSHKVLAVSAIILAKSIYSSILIPYRYSVFTVPSPDTE